MKIPFSDQQLAEGRRELEEMDLETGYDEAAIESYSIFKQLQSEGVIEQDVKFQVSLPTIANVVGILIEEDFRRIVEPIYEKALFKSLQAIQDLIPHEDLAIQIDLGMDMAYWEETVFEPWFSDKRYVVEYIVRMISRVHEGVDLGIHYCYGDMEHKHFAEPASLGPITDLHQQIVQASPRPIQWIHCPVPLSAMGNLESFFKPLSTLSHRLILDKTKLYLGLVHPHDLEGTRARIAAAERVVEEFGIATECGWGRILHREDTESIIDICRKVSGYSTMKSNEGGGEPQNRDEQRTVV
ncbi:hypothetical protein B0T10DRAFT_532088 [Thelonectria olida]|uniref:Methionine synthase n=1 Tax=Thelonectria olida TaxID=1576542 RepID=A0A9P9AIG2_9HYPO|nr:hypothetical protein B0T10DRAFT_533717 [Thelonectria olida]KAH6879762.1 hypothetical protein B0T10DRAFT_532088 [Thelonectria olida]